MKQKNKCVRYCKVSKIISILQSLKGTCSLYICSYSIIFIKTGYWVPLSLLWILRIKLDNVFDKWFKINKEKKRKGIEYFWSPHF